MDKFSSKEYSRREAILARVREAAPALGEAKANAGRVETWDPSGSTNGGRFEKRASFHSIELACEYMRRYSIGSLDGLSNDTLGISYAIFGDIKRQIVLGENTHGMEIRFDWDRTEVRADTYTAQSMTISPSESMMQAIAQNGRDKSMLAKAVGWDRTLTNALDAASVGQALRLMEVAKSGFNKYTRLVKGMLLYVDLVYGGDQAITKNVVNQITYEPTAILGSYMHSGRSYAYCS